MSKSSLRALGRFLEQHELPADGRGLFLRAVPLLGPSAQLRDRLECVQSWRPEVERLTAAQFKVVDRPSGSYQFALYLPTRQRDENRYNMARAVQHLAPDGLLVCAMLNELGAKRYAAELNQLLGETESVSKHHSRTFWGRKGEALHEVLLAEWLALGEAKPIEGSELKAPPGVFSAKKVDRGSQVLAENLPARLKGKGADFGAGYGFLTCELLRRAPEVHEVFLLEAEKLAIDAARENLAGRSATLHFHWVNILRELENISGCRELDFVLMNPPFHEQRDEAVSLGKRFIVTAAQVLRSGGELFMVANSPLPYEDTLREHFRFWERIDERFGYKVLRAER